MAIWPGVRASGHTSARCREKNCARTACKAPPPGEVVSGHPRAPDRFGLIASPPRAAAALALDDDLDGAMHQPVHSGRGHQRVGEHQRPLVEVAVAGDHRRAALVVAPLSACARMPSITSSAPGIFRSASIARTRSLRLFAGAIIVPPPRSRVANASPPAPRAASAESVPAVATCPDAGRADRRADRARPVGNSDTMK